MPFDGQRSPDPHLALPRYAAARNDLLARIVGELEANPRVVAVWLAGSFGRETEDAWSDLDLHIAVADEHYPAFWAERPRLFERVGRPVLIQPEMPSNGSLPGGSFQLVLYASPDGPIEVDWSAGPASEATRPAASHLIFDRVGISVATPPPLTADERRGHAEWWLTFFWAMAPIGVKHAGRGESRQAAAQIDLLTTSLIALWRLVEQPDGPNPWEPVANRPLDPELDARLPRLGWTIDPAATLRVITDLCAETERLHPALAVLDVTIWPAMPAETAALARTAAEAVQDGDRGIRRPYR